MASQRFCLRWNNHQSNLLSVFDQLLHAETFTDVTLAVEGQYLKAHKMVLSACSPYFQALFINHPEKHPIVILKDITFADMKSLLDFMYRGEVSVDQERLTAFLRVAESLRIKGLTEVNDDKPEKTEPTTQSQPQPPQLQRIQPFAGIQASTGQQQQQPQRKAQGMMLSNPLLGSALTQPKRKRGRPRKLSGSSNGNDFDDYESSDNIIQGSPELLEVKMNADGYSDGSDENNRDADNDNSIQESMDTSEPMDKPTTPQPTAGKEQSNQKDQIDNNNSVDDVIVQPSNVFMITSCSSSEGDVSRPTMKIRVNPLTQRPSNLANALQQQQQQCNTLNNNNSQQQPPQPQPQQQQQQKQQPQQEQQRQQQQQNVAGQIVLADPPFGRKSAKPSVNNTLSNNFITSSLLSNQFVAATVAHHQLQQQQTQSTTNEQPVSGRSVRDKSQKIASNVLLKTENNPSATGATPTRQPQRRRVRRKGNTQPDDQAEHLTEMSVRGLDLFRYAKIFDGIYQCTECAKENIQKTFKNKYSFQRHAFLYHEGTSRKVFPCPVCAKEFSRPDKMKNHMKTTHECFMPKDTVYPLNYISGGGGDAPPSGAQPTQKQSKSSKQQTITVTPTVDGQDADTPIANDFNETAKLDDMPNIKIDAVMSQYQPHLATAIKIENVDC